MSSSDWTGVVVAVTGACGGFGAFLTRNLVQAGAIVRALDIRRDDHIGSLAEAEVNGKVQFIQLDLGATDTAPLRDALEGVQVIFHTVAIFGDPLFSHNLFANPGNAENMQAINVRAVERLLSLAREQGIQAFVLTSSINAVFSGNFNVYNCDESAPYVDPSKAFDMYSVTKASAEQLVIAANGKGGLNTASVRPNAIWGPSKRVNASFKTLRMTAPFGIMPAKFLDTNFKEPLVDWVHVDNLAQCQMLVGKQLLARNPSVCGSIYNCTDGVISTYNEFFGQWFKRIGFAVIPIPIPISFLYPVIYCMEGMCWALRRLTGNKNIVAPLITVEVVKFAMTNYQNGDKARTELGYIPISRDKLMDEFADFARAYLKEIEIPTIPPAIQASVLSGMAAVIFLSFANVKTSGAAPLSIMRTMLSKAFPAIAEMPLEDFQRRVIKTGICLPMLGLHFGDAVVACCISWHRSHPLWINWTVRTMLFGFGQLCNLLPDSAAGPYAVLTASVFASSAYLAKRMK